MLGLVTTVIILGLTGALLGFLTGSVLLPSFIAACIIILACGGGFLKLSTEGNFVGRLLGGGFWLLTLIGPVALGAWLVNLR